MIRLLPLLVASLLVAGCASSSSAPGASSPEAASAVAEARRAVERAEADPAQAPYLADARRDADRAQALLSVGEADEATHRAYLARQGARLAALQAEIDAAEATDGDNRLVITDAFQTARVTLRPEAQDVVDRVAAYLAGHPDRVALVESFTDATGNADRNLDLSVRRAETVKERIVAGGVDPARVVAAGFGQEHPVASNDTSEGQRENRRVEIVIDESVDRLPTRE